MRFDPLDLGALVLVGAEWLALGWLSGLGFPGLSPQRNLASWPASAATWGLRLLVGGFLVGLAQLSLALVGIGFGFVPGVLLLAGTEALAVRLGVRASGPVSCPVEEDAAPPRSAAPEQLGWAVLLVALAAALVRSLLVPESGWDAYSHWGLRAQAFAEAGTIVNAQSEHEYYPPLVPLLEAWLYLHRGQISIDFAKTLWALVGGGFGLCLAWHVRMSLRPAAAWLAPLVAAGVILVTPQLLDGFWTGQADLALTTYLCLATLAVWHWHRQRAGDGRWLLQVAIFAAAAALTKFEGAPRIALLAVALIVEGVIARAIWRQVPALLSLFVPTAAAWFLWTAFQLARGIPANAEHLGGFQPLAIGGVLLALVGVFAGVRTGGGLAVAVSAWIVSARTLAQPALRLLAIVVVVQAVGTLAAFLVSSTAPEIEVQTSATRLVEQFLPIALIVGALGLARTGHL